MRKRIHLLACIVGLATAVACGEYPGVDRGLSASGASLPAAGGSGSDSVTGGGGSQNSAGTTAEIELRDFELVPDAVTLDAGELTFTLINKGRFTHDFRVEGTGVDDKSPRVAAGRTGEWNITLEPGEYRISCPLSNHADRGMVGTLLVVSDAN